MKTMVAGGKAHKSSSHNQKEVALYEKVSDDTTPKILFLSFQIVEKKFCACTV